MTGQPPLLAALLQDKSLHRYGSFRAAYDKAARAVDRHLGGTAPSRAQFHRWITGDLRGLPYPDHCRVLEHLLTGYTAAQLFQPATGNSLPADGHRANGTITHPAPDHRPLVISTTGTGDLAAVFTSRSDFAANVEPKALFHGASRIRAVGLSLNLICQQLPDQHLRQMLASGTQLTCLFLDPDGDAIKAREREEEFPPGYLTSLNTINIGVMTRLRDQLPPQAQDHMHLGVYDETIRFNIILVDDHTCIAQPYLPHARGLDSPTLMIRRQDTPGGLHPIFENVYDAIAARSRPL